ncbi:hypothetical protein BGZ57DRAFT_301178 [Hyaloscypha finlandica]|nr:hypothetical protein BGZ57DRAFT_301178 [Hyaloscypha finlandica]
MACTVSTSSKSQKTTVLPQEKKRWISTDSNVEVLPKSRLRFWMVNNRPAIKEAGNFLDTSKVGANATMEVSEHKLSSGELEFIRRYGARQCNCLCPEARVRDRCSRFVWVLALFKLAWVRPIILEVLKFLHLFALNNGNLRTSWGTSRTLKGRLLH